MAEGQGQYTAYDHTDLERRRKKLWNLADGIPLTVVGGIDLRALVIAIFVFGGTLLILSLVPFVGMNLWSILVSATIAVGAYILWPHRWRSGLTTEQSLMVLLDFLFLQPRRVHGLAADVEPDVVHWRVILWDPVGEKWRRRLVTARRGRRLWRPHPDDPPGLTILDGPTPGATGSRDAA
ncbi:MAG TPA: hypothetical protein VI076_10165 [Actinopolymorphaceae bacterium]